MIIILSAKTRKVYALEHSGFSGSSNINPLSVFLACHINYIVVGTQFLLFVNIATVLGHKPADFIIHRRVIGKINELKV